MRLTAARPESSVSIPFAEKKSVGQEIAKALNCKEKIDGARKGENDIAIGNVIGSNIFNIGMVIGIPSAFIGTISAISFNYIDMIVMVGSAILLFILTFKNRKIGKVQGIIMLLLVLVYYSYVIIGGK